MKSKIGKLIKWVAIILFALEVTGLLAVAIVAAETFSAASKIMSMYGDATIGAAAGGDVSPWTIGLVLLVGVGMLFVKNLLIYGFGELIEHCAYTRYNTAQMTRYLDCIANIADDTNFLSEKAAHTEAVLLEIKERLEVRRPPANVGTRIEWDCPNCGAKNPIKAFFCMNCGTKGT